MRIIDCHHHIWDLRYPYPWLNGPATAKPFGEYAALRRDYLISDYLNDALPLGVVASVHADAGLDPADPVAETRWLQSVADHHAISRGFPQGIVAGLDLAAPGSAEALAALVDHANLRGIRQILTGGDGRARPGPDPLANRVAEVNLRRLATLGLSLDLQVHPDQVDRVVTLARRNPELTIVIGHCAAPIDRDIEGRARWRRAVPALAACPNVAIKLSGFGIYDRGWTVASIRAIILTTIEHFGPAGCMFGSDYPVASLAAPYARIWAAYDAITRDFTPSERAALFHDTAARVYRIAKSAT